MKSPFSSAQRDAILKEAEGGKSVRKICCEHSISNVTFYRWRRDARNAASRALISEAPSTLETQIPEVKGTLPKPAKKATTIGQSKAASAAETAKVAA